MDSDFNEAEEFVDNWLSKNKSWFICYAIENLDLNTVEKWLQLNGKEVCKCKSSNKNLNTFNRRKSYASPTILSNKSNFLQNSGSLKPSHELTINHNYLISQENSSNINKYTKRSNSFNSLLAVNSDKKGDNLSVNDILNEKSNTYYLSDNQDDINLNKKESSTKLLNSLIKTKIKLPNKGNSLSILEKLKMKNEMKNPYEILFHFVNDISMKTTLKDLSESLLIDLKILFKVEYSSLFFVDRNRNRLVSFKYDQLFACYGPPKSKNFHADPLINEYEQEIPIDDSVLSCVAKDGNLILMDHNQIKDLTNKFSGIKINSILCMPIKNFENEVIAVVQLTNKIDQNFFGDNDIEFLKQYFAFCAKMIIKAQVLDLCEYEYERNRCLLGVLHDLFQQQTNLDKTLFQIIKKAKSLLKCQRCSILILIDTDDCDDYSSSKKVYDLYQISSKSDEVKQSIDDFDDGTKISKDLANYVLTTGNKINIKDAYLDPRFDPLVDTEWNFRTKSKLIMPIKNLDGTIIGCARVTNRFDNQPFDENDEQLLEAFCIFCGLSINNTLIYSELEKSALEKSVALEVLSYHSHCSKNELNTFLKKVYSDDNFKIINNTIEKEELSSYLFDDFHWDSDEMVIASYEMIKQSGLIETFKIDQKTLFEWLLTVRKNYRDVEYHNWNHAFNTTQAMFSIFSNSSICEYLQDIEKLALIVGCLCHDLDHRGTNNMFQIESHSPLSQLYGTTAPMEKHHFNHCVMILNSPGLNIFSNVKPKTYELFMILIKEAILATDLQDHFLIRNEFEAAVQNKNTNWKEEQNKILLRKNLMTFCDLAAVAKPWAIHKKIVDRVTKEFFDQGDRERLELNIEPTEMMDVRRSDQLPRLQISWIDSVCMPLNKNLAFLCDSFNGHIERIKQNRLNWTLMYEKKI